MKSRTKTSFIRDRLRSPLTRLSNIEVFHRAKPLIPDGSVKRVVIRVWKVLRVVASERLLSIAWVSPGESRRLNRVYRRNDRPTNVLSFGYGEEAGVRSSEIVLCSRIMKEEAKAIHISLERWVVRLLIHGILHTEGYTHDTVRSRKKMEEQERNTLELCGYDSSVIA